MTSQMHVIISNYGNESLALTQWAYQQKLDNVIVVTVDTGWAAKEWHAWVHDKAAWAKSLGFKPITLQPKANFATLMETRGSFPTRKFQWCANFLKALPINEYLDQQDKESQAIIMLARRRALSRALINLPEHIFDSEHYCGRTLWHPLYKHSHAERDQLLKNAGFEPISHRSLECDPCVNSDATDISRLSPDAIERTARLEQKLQAQMLDTELYHGAADLKDAMTNKTENSILSHRPYEIFDMGCGSVFGCGL